MRNGCTITDVDLTLKMNALLPNGAQHCIAVF